MQIKQFENGFEILKILDAEFFFRSFLDSEKRFFAFSAISFRNASFFIRFETFSKQKKTWNVSKRKYGRIELQNVSNRI